MRKWKLNKITGPLFSIVLVLLIGVVIMLVVGYDPIYAYGQLIRGGFGTKLNFGTTLEKITPVLLSGLAFVIGMKGDFFNMGVEGQMTLAAITTAWLGVELFRQDARRAGGDHLLRGIHWCGNALCAYPGTFEGISERQ